MKKIVLIAVMLAIPFLAIQAKNYTPLCMKIEILLRDTYLGSATFEDNSGASLIISVYDYPVGDPVDPAGNPNLPLGNQYWTGIVSYANSSHPWFYDGTIVAGPSTVSVSDVTVYYFTGSNSGVFSIPTQTKMISL